MVAQIYKNGVIYAPPTSAGITFTLVDENGDNLTDESGNTLLDNIYDEYGYAHGFYECTDIVSFYKSGGVSAHEIIEW